ncbi:MAG: AAA family ATPase [Calditrichales bacterium]|nr:AAA family ATPase [Calditrichales bacterium]
MIKQKRQFKAYPHHPPFLVTKEHRRFSEFCDACRRYRYIGLCYGSPGVGKTMSARHYAHWDLIDPYIETFYKLDSFGNNRMLPEEFTECRTIFYTAPISGTPGRIECETKHLRHHLNWMIREAIDQHEDILEDTEPWEEEPDRLELIIVDEADRAKQTGFEQLRDIHDRSGVGLILIGMRGLEKQMTRYPQLYSRVGFVHEFRALSHNEIQFILEHKWKELGTSLDPSDFTDTEAIASIIRITGGNFRLIHRLCLQIARLMEINEINTISKELVETARESLVIGTV